jgi:MAPEG family
MSWNSSRKRKKNAREKQYRLNSFLFPFTYLNQYPNLYAVPGYHKEADAFNRVQRGHQNMLETLPLILGMGLIGGLKYPITAGIIGATHSLGCVLYQLGYSDTSLDVTTARFKKGGFLKPLAEMSSLIMTIKVIYELLV